MIRMLPARNAPWGLAVLLVALALGLVTAGDPSARAQEADSELRALDLAQGFNLVGWAVDQPADEAIAEAGAAAAIAVTVEPAGGSPLPTRAPILVADL